MPNTYHISPKLKNKQLLKEAIEEVEKLTGDYVAIRGREFKDRDELYLVDDAPTPEGRGNMTYVNRKEWLKAAKANLN